MSDTSNDPNKTVTRQETNSEDSSASLNIEAEQSPPTHLGRYTITRTLGSGGFGRVFAAYDAELQREVAIKVPRRDKYTSDKALARIAEEARMAARLQHPGIVTVFDVGVHNDVPYIVMEYVRGRSLAHLLRHEAPSQVGTAHLISEIASALSHAHEHGFVHRDVKPQNILLDQEDRPHVTDFGLAIRYRDVGESNNQVVGTTFYMAPEQVRGENHRIDERTDIWALGVMMYRMLTGKLPFEGVDTHDAMKSILRGNPLSPRSIEPAIHPEIERICMRCLSGQMSERYRFATDVVDDLLDWLGNHEESGSASGSSRRPRIRSVITEEPSVPVVPRGLRSFGQEDGDFFLSLVPGPRDRNGLPISLSFWKRKIEECNPEDTFTVGLLYGPSGCGKSSLVKAGLLPRLDPAVTPVYLDRMSRDMETRLLKAVRRRFPKLPRDIPLAETLRLLREDSDRHEGRKLLIILDQFEQWLQTWRSDNDSELVRALLQCDGGVVQCVLMVRDDFWLPITRFMRKLDVGIVDGENSLLVDSFDLSHARLVLRKLGYAYHRLPEHATEDSEEQSSFVRRAVDELADDNRLYPVRLAVFVEMVKDVEWIPESLIKMGGTEGVGIAFLEHSYGSLATPARRVHQTAARNVLAALMPPAGQIKRPTRTYGQLLAASGYLDRRDDFAQLLRVMDSELRLMTPTEHGRRIGDPDSQSDSSQEHRSSSQEHSSGEAEEPSYQLTHDFLIPSVQLWLENQLRETPNGRAHLLLKEQSELWNARPTQKHLPSLQEWLTILWRTNRQMWSASQRKMMQFAGRRIARRASAIAAILVLVMIVGVFLYGRFELRRQQRYADLLCSSLQDVEIADVPSVIAEMEPYSEWTVPQLRRTVSDMSGGSRRRLRAALALLPFDESYRPWLAEQLVDPRLDPDTFFVVRDAMEERPEQVADQLIAMLENYSITSRSRFRAACALASMQSSPDVWERIGDDVVNALIRVPAGESSDWIRALAPQREILLPTLESRIESLRSVEPLTIAVSAFVEYRGGDRLQTLELLPAPSDACYRVCVDMLRRDSEFALPRLLERLAEPENQSFDERIDLVQAAFELGDSGPLRQAAAFDPGSPALRANLIAALGPDRIGVEDLVQVILDDRVDDAVLAVALMATWQHLEKEPIERLMRDPLQRRLEGIYARHGNAEIHSAAWLLLDALAVDMRRVDETLVGSPFEFGRDWLLDETGIQMVVVKSDQLPYAYAIGTTEVRLGHVRQFYPGQLRTTSSQNQDEDAPMTSMTCPEIAAFCNRLSELNQIPSDQWCYPDADSLTTDECFPVAGYRDRIGYRIPTDREWEIACRAGTTSRRFFGDDESLMQSYGWVRQNTNGRNQLVGRKLPNPLGLFDLYGNLSEIALRHEDSLSFVTCGGSCREDAAIIDSSTRKSHDHRLLMSFKGFRLVRTLRPESTDAP